MPVKPIPEGYHTVTPYLMVRDANATIEFLKKAFGAEQPHPPMKNPQGKIMHAEIKIGDSRVMLGEGNEQWPASPSALYLYVPDADAVYKRALAAGAMSTVEPMDQFYGDRAGCVKDQSGNMWWIATHKEDVSRAELTKRGEEYFRKQKEKAA
ncbi:MAG: VOC family protein [Xanthobacteraceae bacterium]